MSNHELSYAEVVASGPQQSPEEARAPPVPEIVPTIQSVGSLVDVDMGVAVVDPGFKEQEVKTETQAMRLEMEAASAEEQAREADEASRAEKVTKTSEEKMQKTSEGKAKKEEEKGEGKKRKKDHVAAYADDPVLTANGLAFAVVAIGLSLGAYKKHQAGQLTWKLAGTWAAGIAALAGADYALSSYIWKKFPFGQRKE